MTKANTASKNNHSEVNIVDGKLILSLPEAQNPVVWQMDLNAAQAAAFTVQENKKDKNFSLILKKPDGSVDEIAPFKTKDEAVDILMKTSSALQNAHGKINNVANQNNNNESERSSKTKNKDSSDKAGALIALAFIIILSVIWFVSASGDLDTSNSLNLAGSSGTASQSSQDASGVPVSADDFLNNR